MSGTVICTDSSAQLPADIAAALAVLVVPIEIVVDGELHDEDKLDADAFYDRLAQGARATTSQPSPGRFAEAYSAAASSGARDVLSIHVDGRVSGTIRSAELAAREAPVPVSVFDTRTASFGVGIAVLTAAEAVAAEASVKEATALVERLTPRIGNVFVAGSAPGGRIPNVQGLPVFSFLGAAATPLGACESLEAAADGMAAHVLSFEGLLRAAVGHADATTAGAADALADALAGSDRIVEIVRYRVGPSVGAHTGPLSFGAFWWPASPPDE